MTPYLEHRLAVGVSHHGCRHQLLAGCRVYHWGAVLIHQGGHVECLPGHHSGCGSHLGHRQRGGVLASVSLKIIY